MEGEQDNAPHYLASSPEAIRNPASFSPHDTDGQDLADAADDSDLVDMLDDSPERIHSEPLPTSTTFQHGYSSDGDGNHRPSSNLARSSLADELEGNGKSNRTSLSHFDPEPGFAFIDGEIGGTGYNETKVDIVTVPCPGADPVETWSRDPLPDGFFGSPSEQWLSSHPAVEKLAGDAVLSPGLNRNLPKAPHIWVKQGIRRYANTARVLMYRHRALTDDIDLDTLAQDLLENVHRKRQESQDSQRPSRPVFFVAHSIGGLVVKLALLKASKDHKYRDVLYNCHGVTFFATPHRGSSYMSMSNLSESIQGLLHLQRPLPRSISSALRVSNANTMLKKMHDEFTDIASEMRLWTFYETIDSQLSGSGKCLTNEVRFSAPLVSLKSALVGVRQEAIYSSLESDHAHCASFGIANPRTLGTYLQDLAVAVAKAGELSETPHSPLKLKEHVKVELIGFYEDPDAGTDSDIRLYFTKYHLADFLEKGPEQCLEERLKSVPKLPGHQSHAGGGGSLGSLKTTGLGTGGLNIWTDVQSNVQRLWKAVVPGSPSEAQSSPGIVVTQPPARPAMTEGFNSSPAAIMRQRHSLTIPALSTSGLHRPLSRESAGTASTQSEPTGEDTSPKEGKVAGQRQDIAANENRPRADSDKTGMIRAARVSKTFALQDLTAGFSRPDPQRRKFMWIHLPFTNPLWVKSMLDKLSETHGQNFGKLFNNENWVSRHIQGRHSKSQPSYIQPACKYLPAESAPSPRPSSMHSGQGGSGVSPAYLYLYLPYLHFDTYRHIIKRRKLMNRRMDQGRAKPVPEEVAKLESLELRVIWEYLGYDPPLNCRRTLDQFGYPSLKDTYARDDDQMLYKLTKDDPPPQPPAQASLLDTDQMSMADRLSLGAVKLHDLIKEKEKEEQSESDADTDGDLRDGNLLMIDQLWLWAIDTTTLTTFFPKRESRPAEGALFQQADLRNSIYNELNGDLTGRCENALDLAAFVALHAVTVLLDRSSHPDLEIFRIFEEAIGMLTERMTSNLKRFRMQTFREVDSDDEPEDNSAASIKKRHKREIEKAERENRENTSALLELRDMEDELLTLLRLFDTQTTQVEKMKAIYLGHGLKDLTRNGHKYLDEALARLDEYKSQTNEMIKRVDTTRKDYEKMLEMAQRQAQVDDVRWSRLQTELASSQNLSVMIFTIFTVIFLPLSFFTGLFGMNTFEWGGENAEYPHFWFIGAVGLPASAFMIIATLVAAFSARVQGAIKSLVWHATKLLRNLHNSVKLLETADRRLEKQRRREQKEKEDREFQNRRRKDRSYDFWANVRRQRNSEYTIPDLNRANDVGVLGRGTWRSNRT